MSNEQQFDDAIRAKLRELPVPLGLKTRILANAQAKRAPKLWVWLAPIVAIAAAVVLVWNNSFAGYRHEMVEFASAKYELDLRTESLDKVREGLAKNGYPSDYVVPPGLKNISVEGGCLRQWHGKKISIICLEAKDHDAWLFVSEAIPGAPTKPAFGKSGQITTASWTAGHLTYILATEGDEAELKSYL